MSFALAAALLLAGAPRFLGPPEKQPPPLSPGDAAPFFFGTVQNPDAAGQDRFDLAQLVGPRAAMRRFPAKAVLLSFPSSAGKSSRKDLASLESLYTQYKNRGLVIASVAVDPGRLLQARRVTYPVVEDPDGAIARRYLGPNPRYPAAILVDRYGHVLSVKQGYRTAPALLLRSEIESALR
jgi:AhpC/TSA family